MRQRDPLSPEEARELDALERALGGEPVDADLRELEQLVHDVRATAPQMSPGFAARLEHQAAEGFPAPAEQPARRPARRWVLLPAGGVLAAALVALLVVFTNGTLSGDRSMSGADAVDNRLQSGKSTGGDTAATPADGDLSRESAPVQPPPEGPALGAGRSSAADPATAKRSAPAPALAPLADTTTGPRKVQRTAELVLRVPTDEVESTADGVIRTVDRLGGIVASSTIGSDDSTGGEASFDLRIPTGRLDEALAALSKLGHVAERRQNLVDITGSFTSVQDRLSDARAERRGLLRALGQATTQVRIDSLRSRLRIVRSQIARLNGDLDALRRRADLSTVSVVVRGGGAGADDGSGGGGWSPGDAAHDALRVLEVIAGVALVALAVLAPLALLVAIVALGIRAGRRRRRESTLDPA